MKMQKRWMILSGVASVGLLAGGAAFAQRTPRLNPFTTTTTTTTTTSTTTTEPIPTAGTATPTASRVPFRNPFVPPPRSPFRL